MLEISFQMQTLQIIDQKKKKLFKGLLKDDFYQARNENAPYPIQKVEIKEYKYDVDIKKVKDKYARYY